MALSLWLLGSRPGPESVSGASSSLSRPWSSSRAWTSKGACPWTILAASGPGSAMVDPADGAGCATGNGVCGRRRALGRRTAGDREMAAQLQFRDVTLGYDRHPAVHHLSGEIASGALLAVVGPNGAGKSTLFRGIVGILKPLAGIDRPSATSTSATSPICHRARRSIAAFRFRCSISPAPGCGDASALFGGLGRRERRRISEALGASA